MSIPFALGQFPRTRLRRSRMQPFMRHLMREHTVTADDLIWPVFVHEGTEPEIAIPSLPGVSRYSLEQLHHEVEKAAGLGIRAIAVFGVTPRDKRSDDARESINPDNITCRATRQIKDAFPHIGIMTDVALDRYTSHGQDGLVRDGKIINDEPVDLLCQQALCHAAAGADLIGPSEMMDGRVGRIRDTLDGNGHQAVGILAYSAKFASKFYGPFRDAVDSTSGLAGGLGFQGKRTYHVSPANPDEAMREVALDIAEGADAVMVKPGLPYLDMIQRVKDTFHMPTFAYHVSGEYAMLKAAAMQGWLDYDAVLLETMLCFKRAGCDGVLTYAAREVATLLGRYEFDY